MWCIEEEIDFSYQALKELLPILPNDMEVGPVYEEIFFFDSYIQKPSKEDFEIKLQELKNTRVWKEIRKERNRHLALTDYLFTSDFPHKTPEIRQAWFDYRQALRDLPANTTDPNKPEWPTPPE